MSGAIKGSAKVAPLGSTAATAAAAATLRTAMASSRVCSALVAARQQADRMRGQKWSELYRECVPWLAEVNGLLRPLLQCHTSTGADVHSAFPCTAVSAADVDSTRWYGADALCVDLNADPHPLCVWTRVMCDSAFPHVPGTAPRPGNEMMPVPFVRESVRDGVDPFPCDTLLSQVLDLMYRTGAREWMLNAHNRSSVLATLSDRTAYERARALLRLSMAAERYDVPCDAEWVTACRDALAELMATYDPGDAECRDFVSHCPVAVLLLDTPLPPPTLARVSGASDLLSLAAVRGHTDLVRAMLQRAPTAVLLFRGVTTATNLGPSALAALAATGVARPLVLAQRRDAIAAALTRNPQPPAAPATGTAASPDALPARESGESRDSDANAASEQIASPDASASVSVRVFPNELMALLLAYVGDTP